MSCTLSKSVILAIAVLLLAVCGVMLYMINYAKHREDFNTYSNYMGTIYPKKAKTVLRQTSMVSPNRNIQISAETAPNQDCYVYYVPSDYQYACKMGYFDKSNTQLQIRKGELDKIGFDKLSDEQRTEYGSINLVIDARQKNIVPNSGYGCKLGFPDMVSKVPLDYTDSKTIATRNGLDAKGKPTNYSGNWAYCWGKVGTHGDAITNIQRIGSKGAVAATPNLVTQFAGSSDMYYRVQLNDLSYNQLKSAMCSIPPTNRNLPTNYALIGFKLSVGLRIQEYNTFIIDNGRVKTLSEFNPRAMPVIVYANMFELAQLPNGEGKALFLRPKTNFLSQIAVVKEDPACQTVNEFNLKAVTLNLEKQFGMTPEYIMAVPRGYDFSNGLDSVDTIYDNLMQKYLNKKNEYDALVKAQNDIPNNPTFKTGVTVTMYNLSGVRYGDNRALTNTGMNDIFKNNVSNPTTYSVENPNTASRRIDYTAWVIKGYLDIPEEGTYSFKISSDDAGEMFINNKIVSTHYGYHGMDNSGTSDNITRSKTRVITHTKGKHTSDVVLLKGKVPFSARFIELAGGEGIYFYWKTPSNPNWEQIPEGAFFQFDDTVDYTPSINAAKRSLDDMLNEISVLDEFRSSLASTTIDYVKRIMQKTIGKQFQVASGYDELSSYISSSDWVYLYYGTPSSVLPPQVSPTTKQVMQENVLDCTSQYKTISPPQSIDYTKAPVYTITAWIRVERQCPQWRNIMFHGIDDDWTWRGDSNMPKIDRTPGIWIYPAGYSAPERVFVHFRHRVNSNGKDFWSKNWGCDINYNSKAPLLKTWFHYAVTVNKSVARVYINGELVSTYDVTGQGYVFEWGVIEGKKFRIGNTGWSDKRTELQYGPVYIQKLYWWNSELNATRIKQLSEESYVSPTVLSGVSAAVPPPRTVEYTTLRNLFANIVTPGINYLTMRKNNNQKVKLPVYVDIVKVPIRDSAQRITGYKEQKWILILNYVHKARTTPELLVRTIDKGFPVIGNTSLGTDGSLDQTSYGHLGNTFLKAVYDQCKFTTLRFYAKGGNCRYGWDQVSPQCKNRVIHFTTSDPKWISYVTTGKGDVSKGFRYSLMLDHNASIPQDITDGFRDQNDYALTEFPFYRSGWAHWGIGGGKAWLGSRYRYEVDDWGRNIYDTIHQVWIGIDS